MHNGEAYADERFQEVYGVDGSDEAFVLGFVKDARDDDGVGDVLVGRDGLESAVDDVALLLSPELNLRSAISGCSVKRVYDSAPDGDDTRTRLASIPWPSY